MEKRASNTFVAGLNTDRHPLTAQNTELIEARNIDLIAVGEGYQLILQKREGNLEVLIIPPAYETLKIYYIGEYVLYSNIAYKSLQDGSSNHRPDISPAFWEALTGNTVPAGLKEGFIPLAVEEFNNIAYIISVKPNADPTLPGIGELGTFPSPDYDLFKYEKGDEIPGAAVVGPGVYDPAADAPEFGYDVVLNNPSPDPEFVNAAGPDNYVIIQSRFYIYQRGYTPDSYSLALDNDEGGNLTMWYKINNIGAYVQYIGTPITLNNPGDYIYIAVNVDTVFDVDPSVILLPPDNVHNRTVTVTSANGQPPVNVDFAFYSQTIIEERQNGTIPWNNFVGVIVAAAGTLGVPLTFDFRSNNALASLQLEEVTFGVVPAWITDYAANPGKFEDPDPKATILFPYGGIFAALAFEVTANPGPGVRQYTIRFTGLADGTFISNMDVAIDQGS